MDSENVVNLDTGSAANAAAAPAPQQSTETSSRDNIASAKERIFRGSGAPIDQRTPAAPASDSTTSDNKAADVAEKQQPDAGNQPARSPKDAKAISKLVAQKHALKAQRDALLAEVEELRKIQGSAPKREDFADQEAFRDAQIEHRIEAKDAERKINDAQGRIQQASHEEWTRRCSETVKDFNAFAPRYSHYLPQMREAEPEILEVAANSAIGPRLLEEVFTDLFEKPEHMAAWGAMSPNAKRNALAQIEANIIRNEFGGNRQQAATAKEKSNAPAPVSVDSRGATPNTIPASTRSRLEAAKQRMFGG